MLDARALLYCQSPLAGLIVILSFDNILSGSTSRCPSLPVMLPLFDFNLRLNWPQIRSGNLSAARVPILHLKSSPIKERLTKKCDKGFYNWAKSMDAFGTATSPPICG